MHVTTLRNLVLGDVVTQANHEDYPGPCVLCALMHLPKHDLQRRTSRRSARSSVRHSRDDEQTCQDGHLQADDGHRWSD